MAFVCAYVQFIYLCMYVFIAIFDIALYYIFLLRFAAFLAPFYIAISGGKCNCFFGIMKYLFI